MDLRHLRYFETVASKAGFRSAARALGMSQPTLTSQIRRLEQEMGVRLFDRSRRPIAMTPAGEMVLYRARELLAAADRFDEDLSAIAERFRQPHLTLGAVYLATFVLPPLLARFAEEHPETEILLQEDVSAELLKLMLAGDVDVSILSLQTGVDELPPGVASRRLCGFEFVFVVPATHALADRSEVSLAELAQERFVLATGASTKLLRTSMAQAGLPAHISFETNDPSMVLSLVAQGLGVGFTPEFRVTHSQFQLKTFRSRDVSLAHNLVLAWPEARAADATLHAFVQFLAAEAWDLALLAG